MPIWQAPATSPGLSTSNGAHLSQTGVVTSAMSLASGNNTSSQQGGGNGSSSQSNGSGALSQQVGGVGAALPRRGRRGAAAALNQRGGDVAMSMPVPVPDMPLWPADTNLIFKEGKNKILLMNQQSLLRVVIQGAMDNFHADMLASHAFPDLTTALSVIRASLLSSAKAHFPSALNVHARLLSDNNYVATISDLVCSP